MTTTKENSVTMTAEDPAPAEAIPLGSYRALRAWREHREAVLAVPLSPATEGSVNLCQAGMMAYAMELQVQRNAEYLQPIPVAEPLPKRVPQPYTPGLLVTEQVPVAAPVPDPAAAHEQASKADLARWTGGETLDDESDREEAVERLLDIHDTDPAGEGGEIAVLPGLEDEPESE